MVQEGWRKVYFRLPNLRQPLPRRNPLSGQPKFPNEEMRFVVLLTNVRTQPPLPPYPYPSDPTPPSPALACVVFICHVVGSCDLTCPSSMGNIVGVSFASYGTPGGTCMQPTYNGACSAVNSTVLVETTCLGLKSCNIPAGR